MSKRIVYSLDIDYTSLWEWEIILEDDYYYYIQWNRNNIIRANKYYCFDNIEDLYKKIELRNSALIKWVEYTNSRREQSFNLLKDKLWLQKKNMENK
jgi:hypothetical protein